MQKYWSETIRFNTAGVEEIIHAVCTKADDGMIDIVAEFISRDDARKAAKQWNAEYANQWHDEARYQAMYAYACGYHD